MNRKNQRFRQDFTDVTDLLEHFTESLHHHDYGLQFLFSSDTNDEVIAGFHDPPTIKRNLQRSIQRLTGTDEILTILCDLLTGDVDVGQNLKKIKSLLTDEAIPEDLKTCMITVLDIALASILEKIAFREDNPFHQQDLRHILSYFSESGPEFLLIIEPLLRIISEPNHFAIIERGRAARTLINNYDIETIIIYISNNPNLKDEEKELIFPLVITFQKIYRRLQEIIYSRKQDKVKVAREWFKSTLSILKKKGVLPGKDYQIPDFVRRFISNITENNLDESQNTGRALVLVINNEDILRVMNRIIKDTPHYSQNPDTIIKIYRTIFFIMQEYREICTGQKESEVEIKDKFASISRERRDVEALSKIGFSMKGKTPVLGNEIEHELLSETEQNLKKGNLQHLFKIWPIPPVSQEIFNAICKLKEQLPEEPDIRFNHLLFQEKILEFLMRLERLGIKVKKDPRFSLITNAFQLNSFNFFKRGLFIGSTGCWQCPNQMPPSVICCTNPHSVTNCLGHMVRHVFLRVFLGTGEFYESPFILDSTLRYGSVDEEGMTDGLLIRPGLFLLDIPRQIREQWRKTEEDQLEAALENRIIMRIAMENREPSFSASSWS